LRRAVKRCGGKNWRLIADAVPGRSSIQCLHRWKSVLKPGLRKGTWSKEEDVILKRVVADLKAKGRKWTWTQVASHIQGRNGKMCRERWENSLRDNLKKGNWTAEEDEIIIREHEDLGNRWSEISKKLEGRTANAVKNRWNGTLKKKRRLLEEKREFVSKKARRTKGNSPNACVSSSS